jgi:hypothetical protein
MKEQGGCKRRARKLRAALGGERGTVMVVVMMFCMIFLILAVALYWLTAGQIRATETERRDVKAFNVAEAGVDAGMLALKLDWPFSAADAVLVDSVMIKNALQAENPELWDPTRSSPGEYLQVEVYDNSVDGATVTVPPVQEDWVRWDANADGMMFVDASSNVDDDRHRILLLAERQKWELSFPIGTTLYANAVAANGQGLDIQIEDGGPPVYYDVHDVQGKGLNLGEGIEPLPSSTDFGTIITDALLRALEGLAVQKGTYFTTGAAAQTFLTSGNAGGSVVYVRSTSAVNIAGNSQIGSEAAPVVVVIDTPDGSVNGWDMKGSADFYGVLVVMGNTTLRGTCSTHGAIFCSGTLDNKGNGSSPELYYNYTVISSLNRQYVLSVNIVPNTWEEYTIPVEAGAN